MKYLKAYEKIRIDGIFYFIPYVNEKLARLAIEKINTTKKIKSEIQKSSLFNSLAKESVIDYNVGFFIGIKPEHNGWPFEYWVCEKKDTKNEGYIAFMKDTETSYTYGGEITLEDWEIAANKYNL